MRSWGSEGGRKEAGEHGAEGGRGQNRTILEDLWGSNVYTSGEKGKVQGGGARS